MTTQCSLPAAGSSAAPGGVLLDSPASLTPATHTSSGVTTDATDFTTVMSKATDEAKTIVVGPTKLDKNAVAAPVVHKHGTIKAPIKNNSTVITAAADDDQSDALPAPARPILATLLSAASRVLAHSPVKINDEGAVIGKNSDDVKTKPDSSKEETSNADDAVMIADQTPVASSDMNVSTTSMLLALLAQPTVAPKESRLVTLTGPGKTSDNVSSDSAVAVVGDEKRESSTSIARDVVADTGQSNIMPDPKGSPLTSPNILPSTVVSDINEHSEKGKKVEVSSSNQQPVANSSVADTTPRPSKNGSPTEAAKISLSPVAPSKDGSGPVTQVVADKVIGVQIQSDASAVRADGTGVALNGQRMKLATQPNEIAGREAQKASSVVGGSAVQTPTAVRAVAGSEANSSGTNKQSSDLSSTFDFSSSVPSIGAVTGKVIENLGPSTQAASQAERVGHLVNQEVVTLRQSGANTLAVSLKVDQHTELFLQLTNHDGQVQASVSVERGNSAGLGAHWNDLQQSLAKQNIQLMPLEDKSARVATTTTVTPTNSSSTSFSNFNQSSQNPARQNRNAELDGTMETRTAGTRSNSRTSVKTKTKSVGAQGWESWA